ncbi:MAG: ankyrin repeat domain-containing protein [Cyanobacteria bacterium P01_A01_bin.40]
MREKPKFLAKLNHPAIPEYLDYFQVDTPDNRAFYLAQTLAPGKPLSAWVESGWRNRERDVKNIAQQILSVLSYLHFLDPAVIHRDLKPQNIIRSKDGKIFLVDFGAVQNTYHNTLMQGSTVVGTCGYMAPEQFRGKAVPATDLYSLGATLLYLLTHRSPAELPQDTLKLNFRAAVNISEEFADWLDKILEPSLKYRYKSANEALVQLNGKQKIKHKKPLKIEVEGTIQCVAAISILSVWLTIFSIAHHALLSEILSYSPHWRILSKFGYHPLNVCHSYKSMNHYIRSSGRTDVAVASMNSNSQQLSKCTVASDGSFNLYNQAVFDNAVRANDLETVELLINKGVDVNFQAEKRYFTALHWAVYNYNFSMIELLIEQGADVNIVASHPFYSSSSDSELPQRVTPVSLAVEMNNTAAIAMLISRNYKIDLDDKMLFKVRDAIWNNDLDFMRLILANDKLLKSLKEEYFYDYDNGYISLLDLTRKNGNSVMKDLIEDKLSE